MNSVRLLLAVVLIAAAQAGVYLIDRGWTPAPATLPDFDLEAWPLEMGAWHGQPIEPDQDGRRCHLWQLVVSQRCRHANQPAGRHLDQLYGGVPHTPEYCYKAAGWKSTSVKDVEVPVPGGRADLPRGWCTSIAIPSGSRSCSGITSAIRVLREHEELRHIAAGASRSRYGVAAGDQDHAAYERFRRRSGRVAVDGVCQFGGR